MIVATIRRDTTAASNILLYVFPPNKLQLQLNNSKALQPQCLWKNRCITG